MPANAKWFHDRIADKGMSMRQLAGIVGVDPGNMSKQFAGKVKMSMETAAEIARHLGVTFEDIVHHAGVQAPKDPSRAVAVVGTVGPDGTVKPARGSAGRRVDRPAGAPDDVAALRIETPGAAVDGWVAFYLPTVGRIDPEAVGRWSVVQLGNKGARYLRVLHRGYERGKWTLRPLQCADASADLVDVDIEWACPVQWIRA
jgi:DNA-binding XRE family transcriptional regulator